MSIRHLPFEILGFVVQHLNIEDIFNLAMCCRQFQYLILEEVICKNALESMAAYSAEAQAARASRRYASGLRRLVKRRNAISLADPFTAAIIAVAEDWLYANGVLSYLLEGQLRILDLHHSASTELVINLQEFVMEAIHELLNLETDKFQLLHYSNGILSCLFTQGGTATDIWLLVFSIEERRLLTTRALDSSHKIFVRNNDEYLYFGTNSEVAEDGFRRWVLEGFLIRDNKWFKQKVYLVDMIGSDIGSTVCFEIIDGSFFGLSNQTSYEVEEVDWTSFYHCIRFPLHQPKPENLRIPSKKAMWRRQHAEGPIDDRWTFLRLLKDERTGKMMVMESRKEWLAGQRSGRRSYYMTELEFPPDDDNGRALASGSGDSGPSSDHAGSQLTANPVDSTVAEPPRRSPLKTHRGDDASTSLLFTLSRCFIRSYHPTCETFLDLVNDPQASETNTQRLRVRSGFRRLLPTDKVTDHTILGGCLSTDEQIERLYMKKGQNEIGFWPPDPKGGESDAFLEDFYEIMNPPTHLGNVRGQWDERSLLFSTGSGQDNLQALVFLNFDPAIHLQGIPLLRKLPSGNEPTVQTPLVSDISQQQSEAGDNIDQKGKGKGSHSAPDKDSYQSAGHDGSSAHIPACSEATAEPSSAAWVSIEPALYGQISRGYSFAL